jgi:hypothetical protein
MWTPDDFPGAENVPWQLLIRARFAHEIDAIVGSIVINAVGRVAAADVVARVVQVANECVAGREPVKTGPRQVLTALIAADDFDDWCGTKWPHWPGPPRPKWFDELGDPLSKVVISRAAEFVNLAGSKELQGSLGGLLVELGR